MNKKDLIIKVSEKLNKTQKEVSEIINQFLDEITQGLKNNEKITLTNFGTFEKSETKEYELFSPIDGRKISCHKQFRVRFRSSEKLKKALNKKQDY
ncbi:MAG TPA: HU family DNA-binding protein [Acholeplasmataceae bacterium]|nr:HU family DNA-binding protein [Acholeplasmataceae bacterium]